MLCGNNRHHCRQWGASFRSNLWGDSWASFSCLISNLHAHTYKNCAQCSAPASWSHPFLAPCAEISTVQNRSRSKIRVCACFKGRGHSLFFSDAQLQQEEAEVEEQWTGRLGAHFNTMLSWRDKLITDGPWCGPLHVRPHTRTACATAYISMVQGEEACLSHLQILISSVEQPRPHTDTKHPDAEELCVRSTSQAGKTSGKGLCSSKLC